MLKTDKVEENDSKECDHNLQITCISSYHIYKTPAKFQRDQDESVAQSTHLLCMR